MRKAHGGVRANNIFVWWDELNHRFEAQLGERGLVLSYSGGVIHDTGTEREDLESLSAIIGWMGLVTRRGQTRMNSAGKLLFSLAQLLHDAPNKYTLAQIAGYLRHQIAKKE